MEIRGNVSYLNGNQDFKTIKGLFDENAKLSSKNIVSTTAPACWEGKCYEIKIETDDGTPVTFLCDVPNKPLESGTPETAWYVPEEQLDEMLDANICDLIKEDKFVRAYIDKDDDGNPELSLGFSLMTNDINEELYFSDKIVVDENSNGKPEYEVSFDYVEDSDMADIAIRKELFDSNEDGVADKRNEYNSDGTLVRQEKYNDDGILNECSEWHDNGQLAYKEVDNNLDGTGDFYETFDKNGELINKLEYLYDENGKITMQYTGAYDDADYRIDDARHDFIEDENLVREVHDNDGNGTWDQIAEHSWSEKGGTKIRESLYDENGDGEFETYGKLTIKETRKGGVKKCYSYRPVSSGSFIDNVKVFLWDLFN